MTIKKTAFIIGAGAHVPYNMPTGIKLREKIINTKIKANSYKYLEIPNYSKEKYELFCDTFKYSNINSIDKFLLLNNDFLLEGKLAIFNCIKDSEFAFHQSVFNDEWMQFLFNQIIGDAKDNREYHKVDFDKLYFCTFNYDRLLEYCIYASLENSFHCNIEIKNKIQKDNYKALETIFKIKIDHVYGHIGSIEENPIYNEKSMHIEKLLSNIFLINERKREMDDILSELDSSERIFIIGYGFNSENNEILELKKILKLKEMYATGIGLYPEEIVRLQNELQTSTICDYDTYTLLRKYFNK